MTGIRTHTFEYDPAEHSKPDPLVDPTAARHATTAELKAAIGCWYLDAEHRDDWRVRAAYRDIVEVNTDRFEAMNEAITVEFVPNDPYDSYEEMERDVRENDRLKVFNGGSVPEHMTRTENAIGRAVHDFYGHIALNRDFSLYGEFHKWDHVRGNYPETAERLLFTEVVGQLCCASVLAEGFDDPQFSQKAIVAPDYVIEAVREHCKWNDPERFNDGEEP
jgi:hypothetical protein